MNIKSKDEKIDTKEKTNKKLKKVSLIILTIIVLLSILSLIFNHVDSKEVVHGNRPKYCIKLPSKDGNKVTYLGLFYKVVAYTGVSPKEPYTLHPYKKMVGWFEKYEKPLDFKNEKEKEENKNKSEAKIEIKNLDDLYNLSFTKDLDLRNLSKEYSANDAIKDGAFLIEKNINREALNNFYEKYKNKENAYVRIAVFTDEGDIGLYDIIYLKELNKIYLAFDNTRDKFSRDEDRKIFFETYDHLDIIEMDREIEIGKEEKIHVKKLVVYEGDEYRPESSIKRSREIGELK